MNVGNTTSKLWILLCDPEPEILPLSFHCYPCNDDTYLCCCFLFPNYLTITSSLSINEYLSKSGLEWRTADSRKTVVTFEQITCWWGWVRKCVTVVPLLFCRSSCEQQSVHKDPAAAQHAEEAQEAAAQRVLHRRLRGDRPRCGASWNAYRNKYPQVNETGGNGCFIHQLNNNLGWKSKFIKKFLI